MSTKALTVFGLELQKPVLPLLLNPSPRYRAARKISRCDLFSLMSSMNSLTESLIALSLLCFICLLTIDARFTAILSACFRLASSLLSCLCVSLISFVQILIVDRATLRLDSMLLTLSPCRLSFRAILLSLTYSSLDRTKLIDYILSVVRGFSV